MGLRSKGGQQEHIIWLENKIKHLKTLKKGVWTSTVLFAWVPFRSKSSSFEGQQIRGTNLQANETQNEKHVLLPYYWGL